MSTDRSKLNAALRQQLKLAVEQSQKQPAWTKRQMPAIAASLAKASTQTGLIVRGRMAQIREEGALQLDDVEEQTT